MRTTRMFLSSGFCAAAVGFLVGCSDMSTWDWSGRKQADGKPAAWARRPANESPRTTAKPSDPPRRVDDPQAKEVDEKVDRYVKSMNDTYDPNYENNDFRAKMRRQNDPNRSAQIRHTASKNREQEAGAGVEETSRVPVKKELIDAQPEKPTPPPVPAGRVAGLPQAIQMDDPRPLEPQPKAALAAEKSTENDEPKSVESKPPENPEAGKASAGRIASNAPVRQTDAAPMSIKPGPSKPPVLGGVKVSAGPAPEREKPKEPEASRPAPNATPPPAVDPIKTRMEEQEKRVKKDPNNVEEQFKLRLMWLLNGQDDKALAATPGMNAEIQDIMQAQLKSLIAARSTAARDPAAWANKQLEAVEELRGLVRARADLSVPRVALCKAIDGFGRYTPFESTDFAAGKPNKVLLYVEVDNFSSEKTASGQFRVLLSMRQSLLTKAGQEVWSDKQENIEDLARQKRRDFYLTAMYVIPKTLNPGEYVFKVEIEDVLAGKINSNSVAFKLVP